MLSLADSIKSTLEHSITSISSTFSAQNATRSRKLSVEKTIHLLIGADGGSLAKELHRVGIDATPAAVSQRRANIPPDVFQNVFNNFNTACKDSETFRGYRLLAVDGTSVNIPRNPKAASFVCNDSAPQGYNQLHLNPLFDLCNKTFFDAVIQPEPCKDEIGALVEMLKHNNFDSPTLIIADRGYEAYNVLAHCLEKPNTDFLIRVKQNHSAMREIARLPMCELDCSIGFTITTTQTNEDKRNRYIYLQVPKKSKPGSKTRRARWDFPSPYTMRLRIVRFQLDTGEFETIATSLPSAFTAEDIKELYRMRWGIETSFRSMKYIIGLVNLHGKRDAYAEQEIYAAMTMFNFTNRIAREVIIRQPKDSVYAYKVNYTMATTLCREFFRTPDANGEELMRQIARHSIPIRPGRADKRNLKAKGFTGFTYRVAA